jgi:hypothetical protein
MYSFVATANRNRDIEKILTFEGQTETVQWDLSPWEADNSAVSSVSYEVKNGSASVSNESLSSSVASFTVTTSQSGKSLIKITLTTSGNEVGILHLEVYSRDPQVITEDYGFEYR